MMILKETGLGLDVSKTHLGHSHQDLQTDTTHGYVWKLTLKDPFREWGQDCR